MPTRVGLLGMWTPSRSIVCRPLLGFVLAQSFLRSSPWLRQTGIETNPPRRTFASALNPFGEVSHE